jgi:hypothetical protein
MVNRELYKKILCELGNGDITSYPFFNFLLSKEFIYGYYIRNVSY